MHSKKHNKMNILRALRLLFWLDLTGCLAAEFIDSRTFPKAENEFRRYELIEPEIQHARYKRTVKSTFDLESGHHIPYITLSYHHDGQRITSDLHLNTHLIPSGHFLRYQDSKQGGYIVQNFTKPNVDLCHYIGNIKGKPQSRVAISTCNGGVNGVVYDDAATYFIHSKGTGMTENSHFLFRHDDILRNATFGHNGEMDHVAKRTEINHNLVEDHELNHVLRHKRSSSDNIIHGPFNANENSSFLELVLVVDNKIYKSMGSDMEKVHKYCKDLVNIVNALYQPLNVFIVLVGVVVWNESNEIEFSKDAGLTLEYFLQYRRSKLAMDHPNDHAHLLTKEEFDDGFQARTLKGLICTHKYSGSISVEQSKIVAIEASIVAHVIGHNFGIEHDNSNCSCPDEKCIMVASSTSFIPRHWSSCSRDQLNAAFSRGMNYCLRNKPTKLFDTPQCGNGLVELGEQCDCGLPEFCDNPCCDPNTCMLKAFASCATGECCDLQTCQKKSVGTNCRRSKNECDLPEFCTGESEYCPMDVFKSDLEPCGNGTAYCYQGSCPSRNNQCKVLWGPSGESSDICYKNNLKGNRLGNCGYDQLNKKYHPCEKQDIFCGMLHCQHQSDYPELGSPSAVELSYNDVDYDGSIIQCRSAIIDLGLQVTDPGLTPNGVKCGVNKVCLNQKCIDIKSLKKADARCPNNCHGHDVCNSMGTCHCFANFAPPDCNATISTTVNKNATVTLFDMTNFIKFPHMRAIMSTIMSAASLALILFLLMYFCLKRTHISLEGFWSMKKMANMRQGLSSPSSSTILINSEPSNVNTLELWKSNTNKEFDISHRPVPPLPQCPALGDRKGTIRHPSYSDYLLPLLPKIDQTYDDCDAISVPRSGTNSLEFDCGLEHIYCVIDEGVEAPVLSQGR